MIGEYISALSNSATLWGRTKGYLVWGIHDDTHEIVGTEFQYRKMKKENENQNNQFTKAVLFAKVQFEMTTKEDRVWLMLIMRLSLMEI